MSHVVSPGVALLVCASFLVAADKPLQKAREESMASDRFSEAHAPLFQPPKSQNAGVLTERIAPSLPGTPQRNAPNRLPRRNFIDAHIFSKMERDAVPHASLSSDYEFLRRITLDLTGRI